MIYSCEEHVDIALESIVIEYETFPVLDKISVDKLSTTCGFCEKQAVYVVANK
ncbi:CxxH/CxxC protein [Neobacillus niacini]|uniref:CxxH/CxxC protein n=1 Tax=Neobacillus niacini TaxID=86668 RepID=UPI0021CB5118|nr:CxxH/CxxC protein [Neobacillus niacini]MCM3764196.1 CxxH/CxxC protein [Neobacillus niacini]